MVALSANAQADMTPKVVDGESITPQEYTVAPVFKVTDASTQVTVINSKSTPAKVKTKANVPVGHFVATYGSSTSNYGSGGRSCELVTEGDSLAVNKFFYGDFKLKLKVNEDGSVSCPVQQIGSYNEYGAVYIAPSKVEDNTFKVDSSKTELTGAVINGDSIAVDGEWGLFMPEKNAFLYTGKEMVLARGNAVMKTTSYTGEAEEFNIIVKQNGNTVTFVNFANLGATFDTDAQGDKKLKLGGKQVSNGKTAMYSGKLYRVFEYSFKADGTLQIEYSNDLLFAKSAGENKLVVDGNWLINATMGVQGFYLDGEITLYTDVVFPVGPQNTLSGSGTEQDPFVINNTDEWNTFADVVNGGDAFNGQFVKLAADLDFTGKAMNLVGVMPLMFNGTFDGGNHTITMDYTGADAQAYVAPFSSLYEQGTVKNLTVAGQITVNNANRCAGVAAWLDYGSVIDNCHNKANITINGNGQVYGGIVACGNRNSKILNCHNEGTITYKGNNANGFVAGIMGEGAQVDIINCYNVGQIVIEQPTKAGVIAGVAGRNSIGKVENCYNTVDITGYQTVAGVVANATNNAYGTGLQIKNCYNTGNIEMTNTASSTACSGGVVGTLTRGSVMDNCYNTGNVIGQKYVAGIAGNVLAANEQYPTTIKNCWNSGNITAFGTGSNIFAAGIFGMCSDYTVVDSCYNTGNVVGERVAGGVAGQVQGTHDVFSHCWNTGDVSSPNEKGYWIGGVIGNASQAFTINDCWNAGNVSAPNRVGGVVGYSAYHSTLSRCWNVGNVTATNTAAGTGSSAGHSAAGLVGYACSLVKDSYNAGTITGTSRVGGIEGYTYASTASKAGSAFERVVNYGVINCAKDTCGHIAGCNLELNPKQWVTTGFPENNYIRDAYFLNSINENCRVQSDTIQTGLSAKELCEAEISEEFSYVGDYCYQVIGDYEDNPYAKLYAVNVFAADDEEDESVITMDFNVGAPEGVKWTSSYAGLSFDGTDAKFDGEPYMGEITLTASIVNNLPNQKARKVNNDTTAPSISREFVVNVKYEGAVTGINDLKVNTDKAYKMIENGQVIIVKGENRYNTMGQKVAK